MTILHFAQISDIHISALGDRYDMLSGQSAGFLRRICRELNRLDSLDFVLITGDLADTAAQSEFDQFQTIIKQLHKPYYIIPGNHDRRDAEQTEGLTRHDFARYFNPQIEDRPTDPAWQAGYWSRPVAEGVQLIGLDSIVDDDWNGRVDEMQWAWLEAELAQHADKFVMVAIHHPLHKLAPIDDLPKWGKFVCDNGPELLALFDQHPQVKLVLTGHHHLNKAEEVGQRLHLACPAMGLYPCAYRTLTLSDQPDGRWQLTWQTHSATDAATVTLARERMYTTWLEHVGMPVEFVEEHIALAVGGEWDRAGAVSLE